MAKANGTRKKDKEPELPALSRITVAGFKSIGPEQSIEIRPLTLLAGANSSGKSSIMQPLLLMKQTMFAPYEPSGALLLDGPNVKFTSADQLLARIGKEHAAGTFQVGLRLASGHQFQTSFRKEHKAGFEIEQMTVFGASEEFTVWPKMTPKEIAESGVTRTKEISDTSLPSKSDKDLLLEVKRQRCFLELVQGGNSTSGLSASLSTPLAEAFRMPIAEIIHVPGLRGNPERAYPVTGVHPPSFAGTFEKYTANVILRWATEKQTNTLAELSSDLKHLGLTQGLHAVHYPDIAIELYVGRLPNVPPKHPDDRVNIVDVGLGVSQTLPIIVALRVAKPGQLVYIEQPEIHLHPRAQVAMARLLADAANRGVRVVAETHSSLLLLGVQSLVAEGALSPDKVKLHWFQRSEKTGATEITSADLDQSGAYGDWPEDFADVHLKADLRYIEAAHEHLKNGTNEKKSPTKARH